MMDTNGIEKHIELVSGKSDALSLNIGKLEVKRHEIYKENIK